MHGARWDKGPIDRSTTALFATVAVTLLSGGIIGGAAKLAEESPVVNLLGLNDLGTYPGLWVVLVTLLAVWSGSRQQAVLRVVPFLLAMVTAYYGATRLLFGVFPLTLWLAWTAVALVIGPVCATLVMAAADVGFNRILPLLLGLLR